jgi:hypothetical protein
MRIKFDYKKLFVGMLIFQPPPGARYTCLLVLLLIPVSLALHPVVANYVASFALTPDTR